MTTREALFKVVCAAPKDDTVRLVYADHLDEHPESGYDPLHAQFIRYQIATLKLPHKHGKGSKCTRCNREKEEVILSDKLKAEALLYSDIPPSYIAGAVYCRGFITVVQRTYPEWLVYPWTNDGLVEGLMVLPDSPFRSTIIPLKFVATTGVVRKVFAYGWYASYRDLLNDQIEAGRVVDYTIIYNSYTELSGFEEMSLWTRQIVWLKQFTHGHMAKHVRPAPKWLNQR